MKQAGLTGVILFSDDGTLRSGLHRPGQGQRRGRLRHGSDPASSDAKTKFDAAYLAAYGQPAGKLSPYCWTAYDSAAVLIHEIEQVAIQGSDGNLYIPRGALVDSRAGYQRLPGLSGVVTCDPTGECSASGPTFYVVKNGQWVDAPD